jgi:hypothetical protein
VDLPPFLGADPELSAKYTNAWFGVLEEPALFFEVEASFADWNENKIQDRYSVTVGSLGAGGHEICIDLNNNNARDTNECTGDFGVSGTFTFWASGSGRNLAGIFDPETATLSLTEGELPGDGHGEGVASVAAGHNIGGSFDGVAPGAQIVDYDLSLRSGQTSAAVYSIGTFLRALEWVGSEGADVANISYSLFFQSVAGQLFMEKALSEIVHQHNLVIAMSAGNNGPGLSSLNRRAIYPDDVLVAGAFVGKKLYEYVHGVTGLPSQGRVVSYSSRGPGPFGGLGPTVISPLASLTHAPPGEGFRAFSGTSSAAPALAGLAANVISAIRQEGIEVHADLVVQAIRLSGKPLKGVPFLEQGNGLPKIESAIQHYRTLLAQSMPARIDVRIPTGPVAEVDPTTSSGLSRDPQKQARGLFLRLSGMPNTKQVSYEANLVGVYGQKAGGQGDPTREILTPLTVETTAGWVSAPANSFVSKGQSRITLTVDLETAIEAMGTATEIFAEVHLVDSVTTTRLATIPVTIINDAPLAASKQVVASLRTEETKRFHFYVQPGTKALAISPQVLGGTGENLLITVFDPRGVQLAARFRRPSGTTLVSLQRPGWHQVAVTKSRGGSETLKVDVAIKPLMLALGGATDTDGEAMLDLLSGQLVIDNTHPSEGFEGAIELRLARQSLKKAIQDVTTSGSAPFEFQLSGSERDIELSVKSLPAAPWNYFERGHTCIWILLDSDSKELARISGGSGHVVDLSPFQQTTSPSSVSNDEASSAAGNTAFAHLVRNVSISCWVFEDTGSATLPDSRIVLEARVGLAKDPILEGWTTKAGSIPVRLRPGQNRVTLPEMLRQHIQRSELESIELRLRSSDESPNEGVSLGQIELR